MPQLDRAKPAHEQIYDDLTEQITRGALTEGQLVPSARTLAAQWNVSPSTAARALSWLASARLVTQGPRGTFVAPSRVVPGPQLRAVRTRLADPGKVDVRAADYLERAPEYIWPILGLEPVRADGLCPVIRREQVHYSGTGRPAALLVDWIPPRFAEPCPELLEKRPIGPGGAVRLIEARTKVVIVRGRSGAEARRPKNDGREVPLLRLDPGAGVLGVVWAWFSDSKTIVYSEMTVPENQVVETAYDA